MDADNELEGQLLQQFSSLGTTDKDVLIAEFQKLLGNQLNPAGCAFFLDMNNWYERVIVVLFFFFLFSVGLGCVTLLHSSSITHKAH